MHRTKITYTLTLLLLGIAIVSMNFKLPKRGFSDYFDDSKRSMLVRYGEEIFQREDCLRCHTLRVENKSENRISLDGYEGKRSSEWLYSFLLNPKTLIPDTEMPSFSHLHKTNFSKTSLLNIIQEMGFAGKSDIDSAWQHINTLADSQSKELKGFYESHKKRTEVIALIAFLQQIPSTKEKKKLDSIANIELQKELRVWETFYKNSDSLIQSLVNNPKNITQGNVLFQNNCALCHGGEGEGHIGPNLTDDYWLYGAKNEEIAKTIVEGRPHGMPQNKYRLTPIEVGKIISFIASIKGTNNPNGKASEGNKE